MYEAYPLALVFCAGAGRDADDWLGRAGVLLLKTVAALELREGATAACEHAGGGG